MVRGTVVSLFFFCFALLLVAQTSKEQAASEQVAEEIKQAGPSPRAESQQDAVKSSAPKGETKSPEQADGAVHKATSPSAKAQYPLDAFKNFSAVMTGSLAGDDEVSYLYRRGNLMRSDVGKASYNVTDLIKGDTYGVTPDGCLHDPHPYFRVFPFRAAMKGAKVERVVEGKETLDGHSCTIEKVTVTTPGPPPRTLRMKFWEAEDLQGFPIKIEVMRPGGNHVDILYSKVVLTAPEATLFKHPARCQVLSHGPLPGAIKPPQATKPPAGKPPASDQKK